MNTIKKQVFAITVLVYSMAVFSSLLFAQAASPAGPRTVFKLDRTNDHLGGGVAISPDGHLLVFVGNDDHLYLHDIDSGQDKALLAEAAPGLDVFNNPEFSSDGKSILFAASGGTRYYPSNIYSIRLDGSGLKQLTDAKPLKGNAESPLYAEYFYSAQESPDRTEILVRVYDSVAAKDKIGVLKVGDKQLNYLAEGRPISWSDDGRWVYYTQLGTVKGFNMNTKQSQVIDNLRGKILGNAVDQGEFALEQDGTLKLATLQDHSAAVRPWNIPSIAVVSQAQPKTGKTLTEELTLKSVGLSKSARVVLCYQSNTMERIEVIENTSP